MGQVLSQSYFRIVNGVSYRGMWGRLGKWVVESAGVLLGWAIVGVAIIFSRRVRYRIF